MEINKIKVGFINLANQYMLDWKDEVNPERDYNLPYEAEKSAINLEKLGFNVLRYPGRLFDEKELDSFKNGNNRKYNRENFITNIKMALQSTEYFIKEDIDCAIYYMTSYFSPSMFLQAAKLLKRPIIIWTPDGSLPSGLVLKGALAEMGGVDFKMFFSNPDEKEGLKKIVSYIKAASVKKKLSHSTYGKFGGRGVGLSQTIIDEYDWPNVFGIATENMDMLQIVEDAKKIESKIVMQEYNRIKTIIKCLTDFDEIFDRSIRSYLSIKELIKKFQLDFISLKCNPELTENYIGGCLAQNLLSNEGFTSTCNGDDRGSLTSYILNLLTGGRGIIFRPDIYHFDKKTNKLYLRSDGIGKFNMSAPGFEPCLNYQYPLESSTRGICLSNVILKPGKANLFWLSRLNGNYCYHISEGEVVVEKEDIELKERMDCFSTNPPWAFIRIKGDPDKFLDNATAAFRVVIMEDVKQEMIYLSKMLKINTVFDY
jgi:L-fucose/D-arabinose isomerase